MAIMNVSEKGEETAYEPTADGRRGRRVFQVDCDGKQLLAYEIAWACSGNEDRLPARWSRFPGDDYLPCQNLQCSHIEGPASFEVTANYELAHAGPTGNPASQQMAIRWGFMSSREAVDVDADGKAIVDALGDTHDPPVSEDICDPYCVISRNETVMDPAAMVFMNNTTNATPNKYVGRGQALLRIQPEPVLVADVLQFQHVSYTLIFREGDPKADGGPECPAKGTELAWWRRRLCEGLYRLEDVGGKVEKVQIVDGSREPVRRKVRLSRDGRTVLKPGDPSVWLYNRRFPERDWTPLGLPI